ncbi:hypothetical protein M1N79_03020 [Dehalococcoidia bacterium]|nr:hypothetical protein [Dehalococcoidia bacterium]
MNRLGVVTMKAGEEKEMGHTASECNSCRSRSGRLFGCVLAYGAALGFGVAGEIFKASPNPERRLKAPIFKGFSKLAENVAKIIC